MAQWQVEAVSPEDVRKLVDFLEPYGYGYGGTIPREEMLRRGGILVVDDRACAGKEESGFPVRRDTGRPLLREEFCSAFEREQGHPREYGRLYDPAKGYLWYEGCIREGTPWGPGTMFLRDGTRYKEGLFGTKGLLCGREYYPNGEVRFEGIYAVNHGYGPNWPVYGTFFGRDGKKIFEGEFTIRRGGVGYPTVVRPEAFGSVVQRHPNWSHDLY